MATPPAAAEGGDWREQLKAILRSYFQVLYERPGLAQIALTTIPSDPNMTDLTERLLALLVAGGMDLPRAAWALDLLLLHSAAVAAEQDNRRGDDEVALRRAMEASGAISAETHPLISAAGDELFSGRQERYLWALDALINGVLDTPRP